MSQEGICKDSGELDDEIGGLVPGDVAGRLEGLAVVNLLPPIILVVNLGLAGINTPSPIVEQVGF